METLLLGSNKLFGGVLLGSLVLLLLAEARWPRRSDLTPLGPRWRVNFGLWLTNLLVLYLLVPITSVTVALIAAERGLGLFNSLPLPFWLAAVLGMLCLDLANYGQHYLHHRWPLLWRLHRTHHSDPDMDVTTSLRFHPAESLLGIAVDAAVIIALGVPASAVALYRLLRLALSSLSHGNVAIPARVEQCLRRLVITPDLHRVHHSQRLDEQNSNFSGGLIWWDHLFRTYLAQPAATHRDMTLGLRDYDAAYSGSLPKLLLDPLQTK